MNISNYIENRNLIFIEVDNYDGTGAGPGHSLLCCKKELLEPFVFTSVDTLFEIDIDVMCLDENWIGVAKVDNFVAPPSTPAP